MTPPGSLFCGSVDERAIDQYRVTREILVPSANILLSTVNLVGTLRVNAADLNSGNVVYRHEVEQYQRKAPSHQSQEEAIEHLRRSGYRLQQIAGAGYGLQSSIRAGGHLYGLATGETQQVSAATYLDLGSSLSSTLDTVWTHRGMSHLVLGAAQEAVGSLRVGRCLDVVGNAVQLSSGVERIREEYVRYEETGDWELAPLYYASNDVTNSVNGLAYSGYLVYAAVAAKNAEEAVQFLLGRIPASELPILLKWAFKANVALNVMSLGVDVARIVDTATDETLKEKEKGGRIVTHALGALGSAAFLGASIIFITSASVAAAPVGIGLLIIGTGFMVARSLRE